MRRRHVNIQPAIIRSRLGDQDEVAGQHADIANRADHGVPFVLTMIIESDPHVDRCTPQSLGGRNEVRPRTDRVFEIWAGFLHDHGVDAQTPDDGEVFARYTVDGDLDQIDGPGAIPECDLQSLRL
jgi:hypothetical protein